MVDMSATLIHHGHIRLLQKAKKHGFVVIALTTDKEIKLKKGYEPELTFSQRKEILQSIRYVDEIVPSPWLLTEKFLNKHKIDFLLHGHDNSNEISKDRLMIVPRTKGISSTLLRSRVLSALSLQMQRNSTD